MFTILTSKPGLFRTEAGEGMERVEAYAYQFCGRTRAHFEIVSVPLAARVKVISEEDAGAGAPSVNWVPSKLLEQYDSLDAARAALRKLARFGSLDLALLKL